MTMVGRAVCSGKQVLHLGGLFPLSPESSWYVSLGNATLTSALYAIETVNNSPEVLTDYEVVLDYNDTQVRRMQ